MIKLRLQVIGREALVARLEGVDARVIQSVERRLLRIIIALQRYIILNKLEGDPLHHRTGNLIRNIIYTDPTNVGGIISATVGVGNGAPYGKVHEYGGQINIREQIRTSRKGKEFSVRAHIANYPERSFLRSSLLENTTDTISQLQEAINEAL